MATAMVTKAQIRMIGSLVHGRLGWDRDQYHQWLADRGGPASTKDLRRAEAANLIDILLDLANGRSPRVWRLDGATVLQREEIDRLAREAGFAGGIDDEALGGVVHQATYGRVNRIASCSIHQARSVTEALKSIITRLRRQACPQ